MRIRIRIRRTGRTPVILTLLVPAFCLAATASAEPLYTYAGFKSDAEVRPGTEVRLDLTLQEAAYPSLSVSLQGRHPPGFPEAGSPGGVRAAWFELFPTRISFPVFSDSDPVLYGKGMVEVISKTEARTEDNFSATLLVALIEQCEIRLVVDLFRGEEPLGRRESTFTMQQSQSPFPQTQPKRIELQWENTDFIAGRKLGILFEIGGGLHAGVFVDGMNTNPFGNALGVGAWRIAPGAALLEDGAETHVISPAFSFRGDGVAEVTGLRVATIRGRPQEISLKALNRKWETLPLTEPFLVGARWMRVVEISPDFGTIRLAEPAESIPLPSRAEPVEIAPDWLRIDISRRELMQGSDLKGRTVVMYFYRSGSNDRYQKWMLIGQRLREMCGDEVDLIIVEDNHSTDSFYLATAGHPDPGFCLVGNRSKIESGSGTKTLKEIFRIDSGADDTILATGPDGVIFLRESENITDFLPELIRRLNERKASQAE